MIQTIFGSPVVFLKNKDVEDFFPEKIYEDIFRYLMDQDNDFINHPLSRGGKISTTSKYLNAKRWNSTLEQLNKLTNFLKNQVLTYSYLYTNKTVKDLKLHSSWVNLTFQGCEINNHNDKSNIDEKSLIVLYYPRAPRGGSNLVFIHNGKENDWVSDCSENDLVRVYVEEGDIVIFDNSTFHAVDSHNSNIPRMCMAIEFLIEE